jgi:predicted nucleic acid-binding protein
MGQKYLIDTNVLIDAQMNRLPENGLNFLAKAINEHFIVSFITLIEYLGYKNISKSSEEFIKLADVVEIDKPIIQLCIDLHKNYKIKLPDAIIAATALARNLTLVTNNEKDFIQIQNLLVVNPHLPE